MQPWPALTGQLVLPFHWTVGTVQIRFGTFATHLVKAPAFARTFIVPFLYETSRVVVRSSFALVMNDISVCKQRPVQRIECRHLSKREVVDKHSRCVGRVMRASRQIDDMEAGHRALQTQRSR